MIAILLIAVRLKILKVFSHKKIWIASLVKQIYQDAQKVQERFSENNKVKQSMINHHNLKMIS